MNKTERIGVVALFGLLIAWSFYGRLLMPQAEPPEKAIVEQETARRDPAERLDPVALAADPLAADPLSAEVARADGGTDSSQPVSIEAARLREEVTVELINSVMRLEFSSWGGGITWISLNDYRATVDEDSGPVVFDFGERSTFRYMGLPGLSGEADFLLDRTSDGVEISLVAPNGLSLLRTASLEDGYAFTVEDRITNLSDEPVVLRGVRIGIGPMHDMEPSPGGMGSVAYLGADLLRAADGKVQNLGRKLPALFGIRGGGCSKADTRGVPLTALEDVQDRLGWVAVKNKFFAQILSIEEDEWMGTGIHAERALEDHFRLETVSASPLLPELILEPGETVERRFRYYAGPKKYTRLKAEGGDRAEIMEFGRFFKPVCKVLLPLLNGIERVIPGGYGMAIIVLTILVKVVFWPVTHKGTESMKRMQQLQPEIKKLREKFKNDPKKLQEKQMLLYREHKVNPLAGCLPMVIQIPVFIGLFTVLRSAVELRYTRFLWIRDLSEPEGLLAGVLPFPAGGLNILPLLMTATMVLQQKLTPSAGDPQQQKMMAFMPVMMLFIFYSMPSALVLYWTVSQLLSILQLVLQQRKDLMHRAAAATPA